MSAPSLSLRKGFNLVEAAIVLGVVGLVIGGIWVAASSVAENQRWQQTEQGWMYYIETINKLFPKAIVASQGNIDFNQQLSMSVPPPAGWTLGTNGRPKDPYGRLLIMQVQGSSGTFYAGYQEPVDNPECVYVYKMIIGKLFDRIITPTYFTASGTGPSGQCTLARNSYGDYNDGSYMNKCCPNSSGIGFYAALQN